MANSRSICAVPMICKTKDYVPPKQTISVDNLYTQFCSDKSKHSTILKVETTFIHQLHMTVCKLFTTIGSTIFGNVHISSNKLFLHIIVNMNIINSGFLIEKFAVVMLLVQNCVSPCQYCYIIC